MHTNSFSVLELHVTNGTNSIGGQYDIRMTIIEVAFEIRVRTDDHITNTTFKLLTFRIHTGYIHR
jgi:hypothetical protein